MTLDQIKTVGEYKHVQVRYVLDGGGYFRRTIAPGDDYSSEDADVRAACEAAHTPEIVAAYQSRDY